MKNKVLIILVDDGGFVSLTSLSGMLGVNPAELLPVMNDLQRNGYVVIGSISIAENHYDTAYKSTPLANDYLDGLLSNGIVDNVGIFGTIAGFIKLFF